MFCSIVPRTPIRGAMAPVAQAFVNLRAALQREAPPIRLFAIQAPEFLEKLNPYGANSSPVKSRPPIVGFPWKACSGPLVETL